MEKIQLEALIQNAKVSEDLKTRLLGMLGSEAEVQPQTLETIKAELNKAAEAAIQDVVNMQVLDAKDQFDVEMKQVDGEIAAFSQELNQKADAADLSAARDTINQH